ncbi:MAG: phospholipase C, phosphocholine-specific [Bacteroidetes bacterium]|nr:MAG: phospholipase C, phosphocholine-specific [Bacteroidota bacterium]
MDTRRDFLRKAALLSGGAGMMGMLPESIQRALAIDPAPGSTFMDAEHIVLLMQENRSFDHTYGTLKGVRGFNDPRAIQLPNKNLVWMQSNAEGETFAPFRLNIKDTKATWMSSLPHSWTNQVDARNNGRYDKWLDVKHSGHKEYEKMPLTMGYYTREDIPFYYALADAFTICDQHFCSSLTGTTPNRLYFWTGTIREEQNWDSRANVWNEDTDYPRPASWTTFPERLEKAGISWKIYQNDISVDGGFTEEEDSWLANFTDNPIEFFKQFNVKLSGRYLNYLKVMETRLPEQIADLEKKIQSTPETDENLAKLKSQMVRLKTYGEELDKERKQWTKEKYEALSQYEKNLHEKAFTTNKNDPFYHELAPLKYDDGGTEREVNIPKGDVLHQFRNDVKNGALPTVSWLVAPETFSDHPSSAWYGAWYVSEVLDILTQNPEVWKKTIFILTYDENDGYFDHVPPFVAPHPDGSHGKTSDKIDTRVDFVTMEQEKRKPAFPEKYMRESSIGLGYRVPLVIASPWSRGGWVNSQVFDLTSSLQFLELFLTHKTGKKIEETNISPWRRAICGDLSTVFRPYNGEKINTPKFVEKEDFIISVHKAKFKGLPNAYKSLTQVEIDDLNHNYYKSPFAARQERGTRTACALPYQLYVEGALNSNRDKFQITMESKTNVFGDKTTGSPFMIYAPGGYKGDDFQAWPYAIAAKDILSDEWEIDGFENGLYHLRVYGPNGFYREFKGGKNDPMVDIKCDYQSQIANPNKLNGKLVVNFRNNSPNQQFVAQVRDNYKKTTKRILLGAGKASKPMNVFLDPKSSGNWYDITVNIDGYANFVKRYAGRVETGEATTSDPAMGNI